MSFEAKALRKRLARKPRILETRAGTRPSLFPKSFSAYGSRGDFIIANGTARLITVSPALGNRFHRLSKPLGHFRKVSMALLNKSDLASLGRSRMSEALVVLAVLIIQTDRLLLVSQK